MSERSHERGSRSLHTGHRFARFNGAFLFGWKGGETGKSFSVFPVHILPVLFHPFLFSPSASYHHLQLRERGTNSSEPLSNGRNNGSSFRGTVVVPPLMDASRDRSFAILRVEFCPERKKNMSKRRDKSVRKVGATGSTSRIGFRKDAPLRFRAVGDRLLADLNDKPNLRCF